MDCYRSLPLHCIVPGGILSSDVGFQKFSLKYETMDTNEIHKGVRMRNLPKVHNKYHGTANKDAVYIGRGSPFGNPFVIGKDGDRDDVCDKYIEMVESDQKMKDYIIQQLKGKDLVCFCKPRRCHGDYLIEISNELDGQKQEGETK